MALSEAQINQRKAAGQLGYLGLVRRHCVKNTIDGKVDLVGTAATLSVPLSKLGPGYQFHRGLTSARVATYCDRLGLTYD